MTKLILPKMIEPSLDEEKAKKYFRRYFAKTDTHNFIPTFEFENTNFHVKVDIDYSYLNSGYYIYAFITNTKYLDEAIVQTDDFYFNSYRSYKSSIKKMNEQLIKKYKLWVKNLFE